MKRRSTFPLLVILILAVIVITTPPSAATVLEHGPSASGFGSFEFRDPSTARLETWTFSFEVIANKNGQAHGRAQFENLTAQTQVVVRINCLNLELPFAVIGGQILHSDDPNRPKSQNVVFAASDGSLLPTPGIDTITPPFETFFTCRDGGPLTMLPVEDGDIQIEP